MDTKEFELVKNTMNHNYMRRSKRMSNDLMNARNIANVIFDFCNDGIFTSAKDALSENALYLILKVIKDREKSG